MKPFGNIFFASQKIFFQKLDRHKVNCSQPLVGLSVDGELRTHFVTDFYLHKHSCRLNMQTRLCFLDLCVNTVRISMLNPNGLTHDAIFREVLTDAREPY